MITSTRQRAAMALIVALGLAASAGIHFFDRDSPNTTKAAVAIGSAAPAPSAPAAAAHGAELRLVEIRPEEIRRSAIDVRVAGPAPLREVVRYQGEIRLNDDRTAHVVPRYAGVVDRVSANLGQRVKRGELLAVILSSTLSDQRSELLTAEKRRDLARSTFERETALFEQKISAGQDRLQAQSALQEADIAVRNASQKLAATGASGSATAMNRFELRAPFDGIVVEKHLARGEFVREDASIFLISDLSTVWAEFPVAPKDLQTVKVGQAVVVSSTAFASQVEGTVSYVGALLGEQTRTARARVTLTNPDGTWRPGLFVTASVLGDGREVPVAVAADALQTVDGVCVVFAEAPGGFVATPVSTGSSDGRLVEVTGGLAPGTKYAAKNSVVLKSELGKAGAEHGH